VLVRIDDANIDTVEDLFAELRQRKPRSQARLTFIRDGREQEATVILADRPAGWSRPTAGQYQLLACQNALARSAVP
jgi:hypothetical protein